MKIIDKYVCFRLKQERKRLGLNQGIIAGHCDVSVKTVGRWEKNIPIPADKLALLVPLGYNVTYILTNVNFDNINEVSTQGSSLANSNQPETPPEAPDASYTAPATKATGSL